jgi:Fe-S cluster assembly protein SufD
MTTFTDSATALLATHATNDARSTAWSRFAAVGLPTTSDEVWRYAPLRDLRLDTYAPATTPGNSNQSAVVETLRTRGAFVLRVVDGFVLEHHDAPTGVTVKAVEPESSLLGASFADEYANDAFALLNVALAPATLHIDIAPGTRLEQPIVIHSTATASASFPRTQIVVGRDAQATVLELFDGGGDSLVAPLSEYLLGDNGSLRLVSFQDLETSAWHISRTTGVLGRDANLRQSIVGLGARYDRSRNDATLIGANAHNELRTTFLGRADQVHDYRTRQFHVAGRTSSTLLSKGAVADTSRSIYTGLIEIEKGAKRTDARQTNHNLLLSKHAHADSVPNLDIRENDVMCAHASSVGPLDELQRWYLESRGVPREVAERLMIEGFFQEMLSDLPSEFVDVVTSAVKTSLTAIAQGSAQ